MSSQSKHLHYWCTKYARPSARSISVDACSEVIRIVALAIHLAHRRETGRVVTPCGRQGGLGRFMQTNTGRTNGPMAYESTSFTVTSNGHVPDAVAKLGDPFCHLVRPSPGIDQLRRVVESNF